MNCDAIFRIFSTPEGRAQRVSFGGETPFQAAVRAGKLPPGCSMVETEPAKQLAAAPKRKPVGKPSSTPTPGPTAAQIATYRANTDAVRADQARLTKLLNRVETAANRPKPKRFSFGKALDATPAPRVAPKLSGKAAKIRINPGLFNAFKGRRFGPGCIDCSVEEAAGVPKAKSVAKPKAKRKRRGLVAKISDSLNKSKS